MRGSADRQYGRTPPALTSKQTLAIHSKLGPAIVPEILRHLDGTQVGKVVVREQTLADAYVRLVVRT